MVVTRGMVAAGVAIEVILVASIVIGFAETGAILGWDGMWTAMGVLLRVIVAVWLALWLVAALRRRRR